MIMLKNLKNITLKNADNKKDYNHNYYIDNAEKLKQYQLQYRLNKK
jgi:hypothetical protein